MTYAPESDQPLIADELDFLERFLSSNAVCDDAMDIVTLHGFLTAVVSGPNLLMPGAVLQWVWDARRGVRPPRFLSSGRARKVTGLLFQYWNEINDTLMNYPDLYELPLHAPVQEKPTSNLDQWCRGYCKGIDIDRRAWEPLIERHPHWFNIILLLGTTSGIRDLSRRNYTTEERRSFGIQVLASALNIFRFGWEERQKLENGEEPTDPRLADPRVGDRPGGGVERRGRGLPAAAIDGTFPVETLGRTRDDSLHPLVLSPLATRITRDGVSVDVHIYCAGADSRDGWILEVVDPAGTSMVWDDPFATDSAALAEVLGTIDKHGIASITNDAPVRTPGR